MRGWRGAFCAAVLVVVAASCGTGTPTDQPTAAPVATPDEGASPGPAVAKAEEWAEFPSPVALRAPEGDDAWYIVDRGGKVWRYDGTDRETIIDISSEVSTEAEEGLFDFLVSPDGEHAYVSYTGTEKPYGDSHVREYGWTGSGVTDEHREVLVVEHPYPHHNAGQIQFGPDGYLYIAIGDGGTKDLKQAEDNGDPHNYGQGTDELLGNVLRIDPSKRDGKLGYAIPKDNPFVGKDGRDEIWAYGLRNPWRFSFDSKTGDMWIPDVGHRFWEEINVEEAGSDGGRNYGWSWMEGPVDYKGDPPAGHTLPVFAYPHRGGPCAIIGGHVYRGDDIDALRGEYVYGDFCTGQLYSLKLRDGKVTSHRAIGPKVEQLVSLAEDRDGELFALSYSGKIYRIVPAG